MPATPSTRVTETTASGRVTTTETDKLGRPLTQQATGIEPQTFAYDSHGRMTDAIQGDRTRSFTYNARGLLASATDPAGRTTTYAYDLADRLTSEMLPDGRVVAYGYDQNGNLTSVTPPTRPSHGFTYDPVDRPTAYTPPDLSTGPAPTRYSYDLDGDLTRIARHDGTNIDLSYDSAGRLGAVAAPEGTFGYRYNPLTGNLTTQSLDRPSAPREQIAHSYDGALPTQDTFSGTITGSVSRTYDNDLRVASTSVDGTNTVAYSYDPDSLLARAGDLTLSRDPGNGLITATALGASATTLTYNIFAEPSSSTATFAGSDLLRTLFTRDALGRITTKTEITPAGTDTYSYTYDQAGRLTNVDKNGSPISSSTYDQNGNRLTHVDASGLPRAATYDAQDRLISYGTNTYSYTEAGELKHKIDTATGNTTRYTYDVFGSLTAVTLEDGSWIEYVTDPDGRRIAKRVDGALTQGFLYGDQMGPLAELDPSGQIVSRFVYATRPNVPDYMVRSGATYRIVTDNIGSPRLIVNTATGEIVQTID